MPAWKPEPRMSLLLHFLNRDFLWIICFFVVRAYAKRALSRILELNPNTPPKNPEPPDESDSGPYVPFDPYNLPSNPPLRPSGGA